MNEKNSYKIHKIYNLLNDTINNVNAMYYTGLTLENNSLKPELIEKAIEFNNINLNKSITNVEKALKELKEL